MSISTDPLVITEHDVDDRPDDWYEVPLIGIDVVCEDCGDTHDVVHMVRLQSDGSWICSWCDARNEQEHQENMRALRYEYAGY